jgi:Flp pilus assembly protein TadB
MSDQPSPDSQPQESEKARINRELIELLNELRVALPGVQVLFAFLMVLPFQQRWTTVTDTEKTAYFIAFISTALASVLLIAPSPYHRIRFRDEDKFDLLRFGNRMLLAATVFLSIAITSAAFLITEFITRTLVAGIVAATAAIVIVIFWYVVPIQERNRDRQKARQNRSR